MVRLKVFFTVNFYFTVKRFQFLMVRLKVVNAFEFSESIFEFQFLMVRLKVVLCGFQKINNRISIPYGAIKR